MRIITLRKKIIINFFASAILVIVASAAIFYKVHQGSITQEQLSKVQNEISQIQNKTIELRNKSIEVKKYTKIWQTLNDNRKNTNGIRMDEVNTSMNLVAERYNIINPSITVSLPEQLKGGVFDRNTFSVLFATASLNFEAIDDVRALSFISDFIKILPGYLVITNMNIKKESNYTAINLIEISTGRGTGAIKGKLEFSWYAYKEKGKPTENSKESSGILDATKRAISGSDTTDQTKTTSNAIDKKPSQ